MTRPLDSIDWRASGVPFVRECGLLRMLRHKPSTTARVERRCVVPFFAALEIGSVVTEHRHGRYVPLRDAAQAIEYVMFPYDFVEAVRKYGAGPETITGIWEFVKRSQSYGVRLVGGIEGEEFRDDA